MQIYIVVSCKLIPYIPRQYQIHHANITTLLGPDFFSGIIGSFVRLTVVVDLIVVVNAVAVESTDLSYVYNVIWLKRNTQSINDNSSGI